MQTIMATITIMLLCAGCSSTPKNSDYRQDTTPGHNGEHWLGGEV